MKNNKVLLDLLIISLSVIKNNVYPHHLLLSRKSLLVSLFRRNIFWRGSALTTYPQNRLLLLRNKSIPTLSGGISSSPNPPYRLHHSVTLFFCDTPLACSPSPLVRFPV